MKNLPLLTILLLLPVSPLARAADAPREHEEESGGATSCSDMETWSYGMGMCMPRAMAGMPMRMVMVHGNAFLTQTWEGGPRGRDAFTLPSMFMADAGTSLGDRHYLNLDLMGTAEKWTFPGRGTPELLQIGESQANGRPYIDAQHPHSSPVMGLTLSDTISFGSGDDHAKIWFAPRGETTDGPVAFMHRPTGMVNPDAPLGHHIGQDVGHISSTVIGASARVSDTTFEVSTFHGDEPSPTKVDLPMGKPNSWAARLIQQVTPELYAMGSAAFVKSPEESDPSQNVWRYSASLYADLDWPEGWKFSDALIWGHIIGIDQSSPLDSFAEEALFRKNADNFWTRLEVLQRTPAELAIDGVGGAYAPRWVTALTLGYTREVAKLGELKLGLGASSTVDFLPAEYKGAYGGTPLTGKIFVRLSGMKMWDL